MNRYSPYYLEQTLELEGYYCHYYVQNVTSCHREILDVPHMRFFFEVQAEQWLADCFQAEPVDTIMALRRYLHDHGQQGYLVHGMTNAAVVWAVVLKPHAGWIGQEKVRTAGIRTSELLMVP